MLIDFAFEEEAFGGMEVMITSTKGQDETTDTSNQAVCCGINGRE